MSLRKKLLLILSIALATTVLAGAAAYACTSTPAPVHAAGSATISLGTGATVSTPCLSIQLPSLPSVCQLKGFALDLAASLAVQVGVSLNVILKLAFDIAGQVVAFIPGVLSFLASLPTLVLRLLCVAP